MELRAAADEGRRHRHLDERMHAGEVVAAARLKVVAAGAMLLIGGVFALATVRDMDALAGVWPPILVGAVSTASGLLLLLATRPVTERALHLALRLGSAVIVTLTGLSDTPASMAMSAGFMVWVATYAACFFTPRQAAAHVGVAYAALLVVVVLVEPNEIVVVVGSSLVTAVVVATCVGWLADRLRRAALLDPLTGLANARAWRRVLADEFERAGHTGSHLAVAFVDLDGLKQVNDVQGHAAGDRAVVGVARSLTDGLRRRDFAARVGGDEFAVLFPATTESEAMEVLGRIQATSEASFSAGFAERRRDESAEDMVDRADRRMYEAKRRDASDRVPGRRPSEGPERSDQATSRRDGDPSRSTAVPADDVIAPRLVQVVTLGLMMIVGGVFAIVASPLTLAPENRLGVVAVGVVGVAVGSVIVALHKVAGIGVVHAGLFAGTVLVVAVVGLTDNAAAVGAGAGFLVWVAAFSACFFGTRWMIGHIAFAYGLLLVVLIVDPGQPVPVVFAGSLFNGVFVCVSVAWLALRLREFAATDGLTGLPNGREWRRSLDAEFARTERQGLPLAVAFVDVDGLKQVNDGQGHAAGDQAIASVATALREGVRDVDVVARVGGDEFVILLPGATASTAEIALERVRATSPVPFSVGVAERHAGETADEVIDRADAAMYAMKRGRRQRRGQRAAAPIPPGQRLVASGGTTEGSGSGSAATWASTSTGGAGREPNP